MELLKLSLRGLLGFALMVASVGDAGEKPAFDDLSIEFFEKEVRPILVSRCFECHARGEKPPKGGLLLDSRDSILKGGDTGPAVDLQNLTASLFLSAIQYGDLYQMPPKSRLPAAEIAVLTKWVALGLPWSRENSTSASTAKPFDIASRASEFWCWQPLVDHVPPAVHSSEADLLDVDRFIFAKLESKQIHPAPPADRMAILRRVYFDLIGLPPSIEEIEEFMNDSSPKAFESVVDKLLGSVHFGERWTRHWLDLTRYAETRGHEFEPIIPNAWQYRDYVIRALNDDVPYDRFLAEHIAGDLIDPRWRIASGNSTSSVLPVNESLLGTGFWFLGEEVHSPVDIRKDETDRIDNRLDVFTKTFLGLTVACARCHDHKFDAISQRDYYALAGFAISSSYRQVRIDTAEQHRQIAQKLAELRSQEIQRKWQSIVTATGPALEKLDRYLLVSLMALEAGVVESDHKVDAPLTDPSALEVVKRLAGENTLDANLLARWCVEMTTSKFDQRHPLHGLFWRAPDELVNREADLAKAFKTADSEKLNPGASNLVVDFGNPQEFPPIQDGVSFGLAPVERGQLTINNGSDGRALGVATFGGWHRDLFWKKLALSPGTEVDNGLIGPWQPYGRKVRSPEFELRTHRLWYLVRGSVRAYATVNSHLIVVGPLHNSLLKEFPHSDDQWHWVQHGLELYQGHRLHVEFSPVDDGPCSIAMIVQSETQPILPEDLVDPYREMFSGLETIPQRTAKMKTLMVKAINSLDEGNFKMPVRAVKLNSLTEKSPPGFSSEPDALAIADTASPTHLEIANWFLNHLQLFSTQDLLKPSELFTESCAELARQVRWESSLAPAIIDGNGVNEYLLVRGNSNTPKEPISRRFLAAFEFVGSNAIVVPTDEFHFKNGDAVIASIDAVDRISNPILGWGSGRLELARQMLRSPLASRVAVNRIWHHLFGRGIVPTVDNMGVLGLPPSHPELLDFLALKFIRQGWSVKAMIRSLVLSKTYRMSSHPTDAESLDPENQLWHRMPMKRLEGEVIRDSLLSVSGRLDRTLFGPSVPIHLTDFMQGRGRPGASGPLDGNGRRSLYIAVRRNFLSPMMLAFDTPNPFSTVGRRTVSNVPAQALIMMNDPFVIEQSNRWADRTLSEPALSLERRIDRMYVMAFARHATARETAESISFLEAQGVRVPEQRQEAWRNLCHVLFNCKEFVFVE